MIVIDTYTARYDSACRHQPTIRAGMLVAIAESADDRERDGWRSWLKHSGLTDDEFVRWMPRLKRNVYRIRRIKP